MKKASRPAGASSKTSTATKPLGKPEPSGTMGTGGKSTAKNPNSALVSKVRPLADFSFSHSPALFTCFHEIYKIFVE